MIKKLFALMILMASAAPIFAVTDKEMEEARTIAAQAYLRYANDGSGYLDDVKATTMAQLESKLKSKEKENLEAFKSVKVPSDYASWDKARLVEFWSVTFFTSPNLTAKGKVAKARVKKRIEAMTISGKAAPEPAPAPAAETKPATTAEPAATPEPQATEATSPLAEQEQILEKQEEILADQAAIAKDEQERKPSRSSGNTWVYVIILVILIGLVVWLVVFAANMMKKQAEPLERAGLAGDPKELERLQSKYSAAKDTMEQYRSAFEEEQKETKRLRQEVKVLKEQLAVLQSAAAQRPQREPEAPKARAVAEAPARETRHATEDTPAPRKSATEFYLGRVNNRGLFVRADRQFNPGHSIYRLETADGLVGTFNVVNRDEVLDLVANHPVEYLGGGCAAKDLEDTAGLTGIVTESAGTAIFEGGAWKVLRRSRIRYE